MKRRQFCIQHITEEQLKNLLELVQWACLKENRYFLIREDIDWYVILSVLNDQKVIIYENRFPYTAFLRWIDTQGVHIYSERPTAKRLSRIAQRLSDEKLPWTSKKAPAYAKKKWAVLYAHFSKLISKTITANQTSGK